MNHQIIFICSNEGFLHVGLGDKNYCLFECEDFTHEGKTIKGIIIPVDNFVGLETGEIAQKGSLLVSNGTSLAVKTHVATFGTSRIERNLLEIENGGLSSFHGSFTFKPERILGGI